MTLSLRLSLPLIGLAALCLQTYAADLEKIAPYPKADPGFIRQVIHLPKQDKEDELKVEILPGKTMEVDCNHIRIQGNLEALNLEGWGYEYYRLQKPSRPFSTLMACSDRTLRKKFISVHGKGFWLRYNSKLPIVVYVPSEFGVRYRIWNASQDILHAETE